MSLLLDEIINNVKEFRKPLEPLEPLKLRKYKEFREFNHLEKLQEFQQLRSFQQRQQRRWQVTQLKKLQQRNSFLVQRSILRGEYYFTSAKDKLKKIEERYSEIKDSSFKNIEQFSEIIRLYQVFHELIIFDHSKKENIIFGIGETIDIEDIVIKTNETGANISSINKKINAIGQNDSFNLQIKSLDAEIYISLLIFKINILVAEYDHLFVVRKEDIRRLIKIKQALNGLYNSLKTKVFIEILLDKVKYLIYKIQKRSSFQEILSYDPFQAKINYDNTKNLNKLENRYKLFIEKTENRYLGKETENLGIYAKNSKEFHTYRGEAEKTCDGFLFLSKYYLKHKELDNINSLIGSFKKFKNEFKQNYDLIKFNQMALDSCQSMIRNNKLELLLNKFLDDKTKDNFKIVENYTVSIKKNGDKGEYYPYLLLFGKLMPYLKDENLDGDMGSKVFSFLQKIRLNLILNFRQRKGKLPFYLPYEECCIKSEGFKLFMDSSFTLPIEFIAQENEIDNLLDQFHQIEIKNQQETDKQFQETKDQFQETKDQFKETNKQAEIIKKDIEKTQIQQIQVLGIFSALIAFIIPNITNGYSFKNVFSFMLFMLSFSLSLVMFIYALKITIHNNDEDENKKMSKRTRWFVVAFVILLVVSITGYIITNNSELGELFKISIVNFIFNINSF